MNKNDTNNQNNQNNKQILITNPKLIMRQRITSQH